MQLRKKKQGWDLREIRDQEASSSGIKETRGNFFVKLADRVLDGIFLSFRNLKVSFSFILDSNMALNTGDLEAKIILWQVVDLRSVFF